MLPLSLEPSSAVQRQHKHTHAWNEHTHTHCFKCQQTKNEENSTNNLNKDKY